MEIPLAAYASYLPRLLVDELSEDPTPSTEPRLFSLQVAVLFADIAGFTSLTERLARKGPAGIEELTELLNGYFGELIKLINDHGGDTVKFAGDALLAIWTAPSASELQAATLRATQCAVTVQEELRGRIANDDRLSLRINISCGELQAMEVGGVFGRWELVFSGEPLTEISKHEQRAEVGRVAVSPAAWNLIASHCVGRPLRESYDVESIHDPLPVVPTPPVRLSAAMERGLRAYIPGAILARMSAGQSSWLAELRQVTVLFINLPNFGEEKTVADAQRIMQFLQQSIYHYEGSVNKLSVDDKGIMLVAAYGLPPLTHEDDPARALQAALDIRAKMFGDGQYISIGAATGLAFCGSIGSTIRREYTMMGDVVNLAARLMQAAKQDFLCDETTERLSHSRIQFEELSPITVKGKREPVRTFRPLGSAQRLAAPRRPLVGRMTEKEVLHAAITSLLSGKGGVLLLEGDAGMGKSHLLGIARQIAENARITCLDASGDSIDKATPYHACRPLLANLLKIENVWDDVAVRRERVLARLEQIPELSPLAPLLDIVLLLDLPDNEHTAQMEGKSRAGKTAELLVRILEEEIREHPLLLIVEDAHWLDSGSWAVISLIRRQLKHVLLIIAYRPIEEPRPAELVSLKKMADTRELNLGTLSAAETATVVAHALGVRNVPAGLADWIFARVEGHPFFSEELAYALRDSGMVRVTDGEIRMTCREEHLDALDFPTTIQGVITSRLDRLVPQEQLVVKTASVIGRIFGYNVLHNVYPIEVDKPLLPSYLDALERRHVTTIETPGPDPAYAFKHALIQDVAYNLMLFVQRRQLHQSIAEWYEYAYRDDLSPLYSLLAYHWERAGAIEPARSYLEKAGDTGLRNGTFQEAVEHYTRTLNAQQGGDSARDTLHEATLERKLARAYLGLGQLPESLQHSRRTLQLLGEREPLTPLGRMTALFRQSCIQISHRLFGTSKSGLSEPEPKSAAILEAARAYEHLAEIHYYANDTLGFLHACLRTVNLTERAPASAELARAHANLGLTAGTLPWPSFANRHLNRARQIAETIGAAPTTGWVYLTTAVYFNGVGKFDAAREAVQRARELYETAGDERQLGLLRTIQGGSWYFSGDFEQGAADWDMVHDRAHRRGDVLLEAWGFGGLALNHVRLGRLESAVRYAESALELFRSNTDHVSEITTLGVLAVAKLRQGKFEASRAAAQTAALKIHELGWPTGYYLLEGYSAVAEVALATPDNARSAATKAALKAMATYGFVFPIGKSRSQLWQGYRHWQCGRTLAARRAWQKGLKAAETLGMKHEQGLIHFALGRYAETGSSERTAHLDAAITIFQNQKASYDLERAEAERSKQ